MNEIEKKLGKLNILVNNAARFEFGNLRGNQSGKGSDKAIAD